MRLLIALAMTGALVLPLHHALAAPPWPDRCEESVLPVDDPVYPDDQQVLICLPERSNGHLIVFAHGYVRPQQPLQLPGRDLDISEIRKTIEQSNELGFAFATTSYHKNGYAVAQAEQDLLDLIGHVTAREPEIGQVWVVGASEGGLITTAMVERHPALVDGGLAMCGPLAGPLRQIRYLADVRLVFDHLFPEVFPFGVADTPATAWQGWQGAGGYRERIVAAIEADPDAADQLLEVTQMPCPANQRGDCVKHVLAYSVFSLHDLIATAGGWPYDNRNTDYAGSSDDVALNAEIERLSGEWAARQYLARHYRPRGQLRRHLVTLHTTGDHGVPIWHERVYEQRVKAAGRTRFLTQIEPERAGHCAFEADEILGALALLILRADGDLPRDMLAYLGRLISLDDLGRAGRQRLRTLIGRIDRGILDAAIDAVTDVAGDLIDRVDGTAGRLADGAGEVVERGGQVLDNARDAVRDRLKKPF